MRTRDYVIFFGLIITLPVFLWLNAWQANECGKIRNEIKSIERVQEEYVNDNKRVANEIVDLLATGRIENEARKMGLRKMLPEDVILIVMGGKGRERR